MLVILKEPLEVKDEKMGVTISLLPNDGLRTIRRSYIPANTPVLQIKYGYGQEQRVEDVSEDFFFIYRAGRFIAIPHEQVTIPASVGWYANF